MTKIIKMAFTVKHVTSKVEMVKTFTINPEHVKMHLLTARVPHKMTQNKLTYLVQMAVGGWLQRIRHMYTTRVTIYSHRNVVYIF